MIQIQGVNIDMSKEEKEKLEKEMKWGKDHPILYNIKEKIIDFKDLILSYTWYRIKDIPLDTKRWFKEKYQRGKRGWADSDTWGFDYYLTDVIYNGLKYFKANLHSFPPTMTFEEWEKILDEIIEGFGLINQILNNERMGYVPNSKMTKKEKKRFKCLSRKEDRKIVKAFKLFSKYYFHLWD